jgi:hypothetical protein
MKSPERNKKKWTKEEDELLLDSLGTSTITSIATKLGRKSEAVIHRLETLGVYDLAAETGSYRTHEFAEIVGVDPSTILSWIKKQGLPSKQFYKKNAQKNQKRYHYIFPHEFWKWAENHKDLIHFGKIQRDVLIPEPEWLDEYIREETKGQRHQLEWTTGEDRRLIDLIINQKKTEREAGEALGRTGRSVQRRIKVMRDENRWPGSAPRATVWTEEDILRAIALREQGKTHKQIGEEIGRTERSVRSKLKSLEAQKDPVI